jgi:hypothetical protein
MAKILRILRALAPTKLEPSQICQETVRVQARFTSVPRYDRRYWQRQREHGDWASSVSAVCFVRQIGGGN